MPSRISQAETVNGLGVRSYQAFWENVTDDLLAKYERKCVALQFGEQGWEIIAAGDSFDRLRESLANSGADLSNLVFDRVHAEDATAVGVELQ